MNRRQGLSVHSRVEIHVSRFFRETFQFWQRLGFNITPNHYYQPIPDLDSLPDSTWERPNSMAGIELRETEQLELLRRFAGSYKPEYDAFPRDPGGMPHLYHLNNGSFESVDGELLYCFVRHFKPRRIVELGSGYSTRLAAQAALRNEALGNPACEIVAIEPFPDTALQDGFPGLTRLLAQPAQDVPIEEFTRLGENDILFIDSTHVLKVGSDVRYVFLEILPRLSRGVLVHVHDIFLPAEYPREWVMHEQRFWNEQYLLQAFLSGNSHFEVVLGAAFLHVFHPDEVLAAFPSHAGKTGHPGSFWFKKVR